MYQDLQAIFHIHHYDAQPLAVSLTDVLLTKMSQCIAAQSSHSHAHMTLMLMSGSSGSAAVPSPAAGTPEEPAQKKRRGRPPGSKNKPKPPTHVGMPSPAASSKQPLKPAPVFRPTDPAQPSASTAPPQTSPGGPQPATQQQLLASGVNLPLGSAGGVASSVPAASPMNHGPLQHQPAMPQGVQGPSSIPNRDAPLALPAPGQGSAFPSQVPSAKKRGRPLGSKNKPRPSPLAPAPGE